MFQSRGCNSAQTAPASPLLKEKEPSTFFSLGLSGLLTGVFGGVARMCSVLEQPPALFPPWSF